MRAFARIHTAVACLVVFVPGHTWELKVHFSTPASIHPRACMPRSTLLCFLDTCINSPSCVHLPRSTLLLPACVFWTPASIHPRACICQDPHCCCLPVFSGHLHQFTLVCVHLPRSTLLCFLDTCINSLSCVHLLRSTLLLAACVCSTPASIHPRVCMCQDQHCCWLPVFECINSLSCVHLLRSTLLCLLDTYINSLSCVHVPGSTLLLPVCV